MFDLKELLQTTSEFMDRNASKILQSEDFLVLSSDALVKLISRNSFCSDEMNIFKGMVQLRFSVQRLSLFCGSLLLGTVYYRNAAFQIYGLIGSSFVIIISKCTSSKQNKLNNYRSRNMHFPEVHSLSRSASK